MARLVFNADGWFEKGADSKDELQKKVYLAKQELRSRITDLNGQNLEADKLRSRLECMDLPWPFFEKPYASPGEYIYVRLADRSQIYIGHIVSDDR
jgi:hypothetical protein